MKKTILYIVLAMLCLNFQAAAQIKSLSTGLKIGDKVPDVTINNIINYSAQSAKISDFEGKLLILDFWATWCSSCISHFPENYVIQQRFKDEVQFLMVNSKLSRDTKQGINDFFYKRKKFYQFPCIVLDTVLTTLFPHQSIPHYVIIKNEKVLAITDGENITSINISKLINDESAKLFVKRDQKLKKQTPLFLDGNGGAFPKNYYRSIITGKIDVLGNNLGFQTDSVGLITRIYAVNQIISSLYIMASPEFSNYNWSRMIFEIPHPESFLKDSLQYNLPVSQRVFSYESIFPPTTKDFALQYMRSDLDRFFHLRIDSEYRDTLCFVMRIDPKNLPSKIKTGNKREMNLSEHLEIPKYFHNATLESLRNELQELYSIPFFNETGYTSNVSFDFPSNILKEQELMNSLKKQGILLTKERRKVSYMVFRQVTGPNP